MAERSKRTGTIRRVQLDSPLAPTLGTDSEARHLSARMSSIYRLDTNPLEENGILNPKSATVSKLSIADR